MKPIKEPFTKHGELFVPDRYKLFPSTSIEDAAKEISSKLNKVAEEFVEFALGLVFPQEVVKLMGKVANNPRLSKETMATLNQLGVVLKRILKPDGGFEMSLILRPRRKDEPEIFVAHLEVKYENNKWTATRKSNPQAGLGGFDLRSPILRRWLRQLCPTEPGANELLDIPINSFEVISSDGELPKPNSVGGEPEREVSLREERGEGTLPVSQDHVDSHDSDQEGETPSNGSLQPGS